MKKTLFASCIVLMFAALAVGSQYVTEMKVKVFTTPSEFGDLADNVLEFYEATPEWFIGAVEQPFYEELLAKGFRIEVIVPDVRAAAMLNDAFFHTYEQIRDTWATIARNHPGICKLDTIGSSYNGHLLLAMKVSSNPQVMEQKPRICFDFTIHGNENNGTEIAHWALLQIVNGYGSDPDITRWVNTREIWLLPMVNPDGLILRRRTNGNNVDLNRNYGYSWNGGGSAVFSESETRALYFLGRDNPMASWTQYHTGTRSAMWPWGYTQLATMDSVVHRYEMQRYGQITGYPAYQISRGLYPVNGGSTDWYYGAAGALGFGVEVCNGQPSPVGEIDTINKANWSAMKEMIERVSWGVRGVVRDSLTGLPVEARVSFTPPDWFMLTDTLGFFAKNLHAGTYSVRVEANGYAAKALSGVIVPADSFISLAVDLVPDSTAPASALMAITNKLGNTNATNHWWALGRRNGRRFVLDRGAWASFDMGRRTPIMNGPGSDFSVVGDEASPAVCSVYVSDGWNGPWTGVGYGAGTLSLDLTSAGMQSARFVRIVDDNNGTPGFAIDAVEAVVVNAPMVVYQRQAVLDSPPGGNNDGKLDPGEEAGVVMTLKNAGRVGVSGLTAVLRTGDQYVSVIDSTGSFGDMMPDSVRSNNADKFRVAADAGTPREHAAQMTLYLAGTDYADSIRFTIVVGEMRAIDPIPDGPRQPARYWAFDDVDTGYASHPQYDWVEIRGIGTRLTLSDDQTVVVTLPTGFGPWRYYGQSYTQVAICGNGWITPGTTTSSSYTNTSLPDGQAPANLALLWDDLYPSSGGGVWHHHDAANHRFIIEFDSVCKYSPRTSFIKGEYIIYDTTVHSPTGDNIIVVQYHSGNDFTSSTVGIEDPTYAVGIECLYNGTYNRGCAPLEAGRAIKYTTQDPTGVSEPVTGSVVLRRLEIASVSSPARGRSLVSYVITKPGRVSLEVYDGSGRLVRTMTEGVVAPGRHHAVWVGDDDHGRRVAAGVYWLRLSDETGSVAAKAILLR